MFGVTYRRIKIIQPEDVTVDFLGQFYRKAENISVVLALFCGQSYISNIAYEEIPQSLCRSLPSMNLYYYFLYRYGKDKTVDAGETAEEQAKKRLEENPGFHFVMVKEEPLQDMQEYAFYCNVLFDGESYLSEIREVRAQLKRKGIQSYMIRIPRLEEIAAEFRHSEWVYGTKKAWPIWCEINKKEVAPYLGRITDLGYEEARKEMLGEKLSVVHDDTYHGGVYKTLFLVGPCIVAGWNDFQGEALSDKLSSELAKAGLEYSIVKIVIPRGTEDNVSMLLENDIHKNDIVFFIDVVFSLKETDFNVANLYNHYWDDKWLYEDAPLHTTSTGNKLIAEELVRKIIVPIVGKSLPENDNVILHKGQPQLTGQEKKKLQEYLDSIEKYNKEDQVIGACVMNCNPFTLGHRYLLEYASQQADVLYLFVLEEDASFFTFEERLEMVQKGTKDLDNVKVYPSGSFMISKETFKNYFEKDVCQDIEIDAAKDTMIFRDYVAPALGITKRFVGEEPKDAVTRQYNQLLKKDLSETIEVVEIPRKTAEEDVISASKVREYLREENWDGIKKMVPPSTFSWLQVNFRSLKERMYRKETRIRKSAAWCRRELQFIDEHEKVVICGLGNDGKALIDQLDECQLEKVEFYDARADQEDFSYKGKQVIGPKRLLTEYRDFYMLVATRAFGMEIFCFLTENNIPWDHIMAIW